MRTIGMQNIQIMPTGGHPVVYSEWLGAPGAPTVLFYGHYDVQPVDPLNLWTSPPFEMNIRDGKMFARGTADDKGQVFCLLRAIEACDSPPVNFRFLIEGEEEFGSKVLFDLLKREPERVDADAVLVADMSYVAPGWPSVYTALRGIYYAEITVRTAKTDLHSGEYGGAAPNAHEALVRTLARLKKKNGRIRIPGLYEAVKLPGKAERAAWKKLPFSEKDFLKKRIGGKALTGLEKYTVLERLWALPTFEIHGIMGGFTGQGAKTVIPAEATAKVSLRLVPDQKVKTVGKQLAAAVQRAAPAYADATVRFVHGADPAQVDVSRPVFALLGQAFREVVGRGTVPVRAGGSIPVVPALGQRGAPVVLTGVGLPDDRLHAPDEKLDLQQLWDGIDVFKRFFQLLAENTEDVKKERRTKASHRDV